MITEFKRKPLFQLFAGIKLAIILMAILILIVAYGTYLESRFNSAVAQAVVYRSPLFQALLAMLGLNIFCATIMRWPFRKRHYAFVTTHVGILILLSGCFVTNIKGIDGQLRVIEGESESTIKLPELVIALYDEKRKLVSERFFRRNLFSGSLEQDGELKLGDEGEVKVIEHLRYFPHIFQNKVGSVPLESDEKERVIPNHNKTPKSAVKIEVDGQIDEAWVIEGESRKISFKEKTWFIYYGKRNVELPFSIELLKFNIVNYPGSKRPMEYSSEVILDETTQKSLITMNEPARILSYRIYQVGFEKSEVGKIISVYSVNYDPGRWLKYLGSFILSVGIIALFLFRPSRIVSS